MPVISRRSVRMGLARIDKQICWPYQGIACRACWHACPFATDAIIFDPLGRPAVSASACVGCGLCEHACLAETAAITVEPFAHGTADIEV
ncbi:MAG: hypothetical protein R3E01_31055 [Pirellulaceae bacterium]